MSQIDLESFHRLEEFPSFVSCIRSFGKPIIPPLITPNHVHELRQFRAAAVSKETHILRRKENHLRDKRDQHALSMLLENDFQPNSQESCALWYPSYLDNQDVSVAISKFPTSGIYSSVHTDAIVCSNVVGSNHAYNTSSVKDVLVDSGSNIADCIECSHSNVNLECSLCLAELNQNLCSKSFPTDLSPEVPCRTFSLLPHSDGGVMEEGSNTTIEEGECESLPTIICNRKNVHPDTDSESNTTCMTQSTDLEKYMELSCEFSSPDNSAVVWDSKTSSQQCTLSRSDDASSETIVNTENELTPCASMMAEFTDNIEDELSNAEETTNTSNNKEATMGEMKRAHSVDSYMKILQNSGKNLNVKKSQSEPFNTNRADVSDAKTSVAFKTNLLIKEDSKESDEAKDVPEKDECNHEREEAFTNVIEVSEPNSNKEKFSQKRHVRQNSYTLDQPSSALILAHADCACNFDTECISPHCSALKETSKITSNSAFVKEKIAISNSPAHMKMLPILNSGELLKSSHSNKQETSSTVVEIFPNVKEGSCEKLDSGNAKSSMNVCATGINECSELGTEEYLSESFLENMNLSDQPKHLQYIQHICDELKANHELRVKQLREKQNRQWLELEEEFKQQEKLLYEKLMIDFESSTALSSSTNRDNPKESDLDCCNDGKISEDKCSVEDELPTSNSSGLFSDKSPSSINSSSTQTSMLSIPNKCSLSSISPPEMSVFCETARALSPSKECVSSDKNPSTAFEAVKTEQFSKDSHVSVACLRSHGDSSESVSDVNGFPHPASFVPHYNNLPECRSAIAVPIYNNCDKIAACFCDNNFQTCRCCSSFNGYSEYDINRSPPYRLSAREQNSVLMNGHANSRSDNTDFQTQSSCSVIHNESAYSVSLNNSAISLTHMPKKSNYCISCVQKETLTSLPNGELSSVQQHEKDQKKNLTVSVKQKSPIDNVVSVLPKPSKTGSCILHDSALVKKMVIDPIFVKKFEKLPAFVKGYLTRRLLKTEHVQNLIKTFKDTLTLIGKMREDLPTKQDSMSQGDIDFQRQLIVLLMTTYDHFYDTFFTITTKEQMDIISESRNFKLKKKTIGPEQEPNLPVTTVAPESAACKPYKLSSATMKVLERKKRPNIDSRTYNVEDLRKARSRSVLDMRTYTIDDLPTFRGRAQSSMSSKSVSLSPSSIYKGSVNLKRKTASAKSSGSKGCVHQKWVP